MTKLSVNVNKIATLRNSRQGTEPNLLYFVNKIIEYGAHGITVHPRADQRHITRQDAIDIANHVKKVETNFEGDIREDFLDLTLKMKPTQCTLVPVTYGEVTSNHGWDVDKNDYILKSVINKLKQSDIRVSMFMDVGNFDAIEKAANIGTDRIELYTEPFAKAFSDGNYSNEMKSIRETVEFAKKIGLGCNAGHDLTHENLPYLLEAAPDIDEVSIGHHIMSYALEVGIEKSIKAHLNAIK
jgi:pyridoxine 5-phosphate synthase